LWRDSAQERDRIDRIFETIRLTALRQRVAAPVARPEAVARIGMLLAQDPKLLLVDEPVAGMTDAETHQTAELLRRSTASTRWWWSSTT